MFLKAYFQTEKKFCVVAELRSSFNPKVIFWSSTICKVTKTVKTQSLLSSQSLQTRKLSHICKPPKEKAPMADDIREIQKQRMVKS